MGIPFVDLQTQYRELKSVIDQRIQRVLDHGQFIMGPEVGELEHRLVEFTGARHCVTCASGTDALLMALMAIGVGPGDEVVTSPFSFIATAEVIVLVGATPIFVDIDEQTCNLDFNLLRQAITPRTKAIIPVSLYGQPADMDEINAIASQFSVPVIEDAAQSFGADYKRRASGNLSLIGCTSFFPSKPLGCYGDGGAMFTNDDTIAQAMREMRVHGQSKRYHHTRIGISGRMDTLQCAVVLAKLESFSDEIERRQRIGERYTHLFESHGGRVGLVRVKPDRTSTYAQYSILIDGRDDVRRALDCAGVPTAVHYPKPIHEQPAYSRWSGGRSFPVSESVAKRVLSLPMHAFLNEVIQERVVDAVVAALSGEVVVE